MSRCHLLSYSFPDFFGLFQGIRITGKKLWLAVGGSVGWTLSLSLSLSPPPPPHPLSLSLRRRVHVHTVQTPLLRPWQSSVTPPRWPSGKSSRFRRGSFFQVELYHRLQQQQKNRYWVSSPARRLASYGQCWDWLARYQGIVTG